MEIRIEKISYLLSGTNLHKFDHYAIHFSTKPNIFNCIMFSTRQKLSWICIYQTSAPVLSSWIYIIMDVTSKISPYTALRVSTIYIIRINPLQLLANTIVYDSMVEWAVLVCKFYLQITGPLTTFMT